MRGSILGNSGEYWIWNNCYFWKGYKLVNCSFSSSCLWVQSLILQMRNGRLKNLWKKIKDKRDIYFSGVETIHYATQSWFATYLWFEFLSGWMVLFLLLENFSIFLEYSSKEVSGPVNVRLRDCTKFYRQVWAVTIWEYLLGCTTKLLSSFCLIIFKGISIYLELYWFLSNVCFFMVDIHPTCWMFSFLWTAVGSLNH